ncbi:hypothetical protein DIY16_05540 [Streptococcus iniae]|nr:hypothetical protein DIY16_05540 [Streptococcus iniae]
MNEIWKIKKHRIGVHFFKLITDKPYFNLLCCFEWFQQNNNIISLLKCQGKTKQNSSKTIMVV